MRKNDPFAGDKRVQWPTVAGRAAKGQVGARLRVLVIFVDIVGGLRYLRVFAVIAYAHIINVLLKFYRYCYCCCYIYNGKYVA